LRNINANPSLDSSFVSQNERKSVTLGICGICGEKYDEGTYQIVVPGLRASFDKVECAELALKEHLQVASRPALEDALIGEVERLREQLREVSGRVSSPSS
jgi:hypothetical protein